VSETFYLPATAHHGAPAAAGIATLIGNPSFRATEPRARQAPEAAFDRRLIPRCIFNAEFRCMTIDEFSAV
jgi:hypothetical protein